MAKRLVFVIVCLSAFLVQVPQAHAAARLVAQKSTRSAGGVYISVGLQVGHHYRVDVRAPRRTTFTGVGGENYTYVSKQRLFTATKPFQFRGTTPKSFTVRQGIKGNVKGWILYMGVSVTHGHAVTLRVYDMGAR